MYPNLSQLIQTYLNLYEPLRTYPNLSAPIQTYTVPILTFSNLSKPIQAYPSLSIRAYQNLSAPIQTCPNLPETIWTYPTISEPVQSCRNLSNSSYWSFASVFQNSSQMLLSQKWRKHYCRHPIGMSLRKTLSKRNSMRRHLLLLPRHLLLWLCQNYRIEIVLGKTWCKSTKKPKEQNMYL